MVTGLQRFASFLVVMFMWAVLPGCGGGGDSPAPPGGVGATSQMEIKDIGTFNLATGARTSPLSLDVPAGTASVMLVADGQNPSAEVHIEELIDPSDKVLVRPTSTFVDPIGRNDLKTSTPMASGIFPHTPQYGLSPGTYKFRVASYKDPSAVHIRAIINHRENPAGGTLDVNLIFCGIPDLNKDNALTDPSFQGLFNEFKRIYALANIQVNVAGTFNCNDASRLGTLNILDEEFGDLVAQSSVTGNDAMNFFFVKAFEGHPDAPSLLGIARKLAGPALLPGTRYSGVVMTTLGGGLSGLSPAQLEMQGATMAHEGAHFLGLFHTTERCGAGGTLGFLEEIACLGLGADLYGRGKMNSWDRVDPIQDTPECPALFIGQVSVNDCLNFDGRNLMFWTAPPLPNNNPAQPKIVQEQLTAGQKFVLHRNPYIH